MTLYKLTEAWDMIKETHVENGWVRGVAGADPHVISFKGIPFAAPPVGKLRWHAPMPAEDWEGVLDCCRFGAISPRELHGSLITSTRKSGTWIRLLR